MIPAMKLALAQFGSGRIQIGQGPGAGPLGPCHLQKGATRLEKHSRVSLDILEQCFERRQGGDIHSTYLH